MTMPSDDDDNKQPERPAKQEDRADDATSTGPTFAARESHQVDLSDELSKTLPRGPGEHVRCRCIGGNRYRCNWWSLQGIDGYDNPGMGGMMVTTHRVIRSQSVRAVKTANGLIVDAAAKQ